jgi:uncharacterized protein
MPLEIRIEIVYAEPQRGIIKSFALTPGALVRDALAKAAADPDFSKVDLANSPVGIFGKLTRTDQVLNDGDRIEIYRPLTQEPKVARRSRARKLRQ